MTHPAHEHEAHGAHEADILQPFDVTPGSTASDVVGRMADTAFQARNLGQAAQIWDNMVRDDATIFFGLAGAMVPAGMRPVIVWLIENRLIDVLVSTGANLYHDVYETLGFEHAQGDPEGDDVRLAHLRVVRFFDVLAPEHEFSRGERFCTEFSLTLDDDHAYTTREYFAALGKAMAPVAKNKGIVTAAAEHGVPIYCPAFGDSVHGLAVAEGRLRTGKRIMFDVVGDLLEMAHMALKAETTGVIYVGGGTPKNYIQQCGVAGPDVLIGNIVDVDRFAHLVIALVFWGCLRDPVRNVWVVDFGMIACAAVIPFALVSGRLRGIPWFWQGVDMSFGVLGFVPLWFARRAIRRLPSG
jgi:deoxyhypusine synthase